jgi:hypothetical protein
MIAQKQPRLGIVVEDDVEKRVIESLARKVADPLHLPTEPRIGSIRLGGSPRVHEQNMLHEIFFFLNKGYPPPILVFFGTETQEPREIASLVDRFERRLMIHRLERHARLVPVVPSVFDDWVLKDEIALQQIAERVRQAPDACPELPPEQMLKKWLALWWRRSDAEGRELFGLLDPDRIRPHSPSFAQFERLAREILLAQVAPAQGAEAQPPASP